jgi:glycosyltransferase involved in cell wall biosynthesis
MMRLFIVSAVYLPEPVISAQTSAQIAEKMAKLGHQVKLLAPFPSRPMGQIYPQYRRGLLQSEICPQGYEIIRCFSFFSSVSSLLSRFFENISFGLSTFFVLLFHPRADIVYGNTWPIFAQGLLMLVCKLRRMPLVLSVQDLYPESLFVQKRGFEKTSRLYDFLRWLDAQITRNCSGLIVISDQFKEIYVSDRQIPENKITVIPNWIDDSHIVTTYTGDGIREKYNIPADGFLSIYGGNIGTAARVETLIEAYHYLAENFYLLIAGEGSHFDVCQRLGAVISPERIKFYCPWPVEQTFQTYETGDVLVLPTFGPQSLVSLPSKMLSYMLAGKPIIALAYPESELAKLILLSGCGWVVSPDEPEKLANMIEQVSKMDAAVRAAYGISGQNYLLKHMTADVCLPKICNVLENAAQDLR